MKSGWKKYSSDDTEYIFRVAGKVPLPVIAGAIGRTARSVQKFCSAHGVSVRVPLKELRKHWPDYVPSHWRKAS